MGKYDFPETLVSLVSEGNIVPFIGAGLSIGVKESLFPTWVGLLEKLADKLDREQKPDEAQLVRIELNRGNVFKAAEEAYCGLGKSHFNELMLELFDVEMPLEADLAVHNAVWGLRPRLVLTTNYDSVLEWSKPNSIRLINNQVSELARLETDASSERPCVWHIHGHIGQLDSLILAPAMYKKLYEERPGEVEHYSAALDRLRSILRDHPLLFIGFGLSDRYVMEQMRDVLKVAGGATRPSYALVKKGQINEAEVWREFNVQLIHYEDHGAPLAKKLCDLAARAGVESIGNSNARPELVIASHSIGIVPRIQLSETRVDRINSSDKKPLPEISRSLNLASNSSRNAEPAPSLEIPGPPPVHTYSGLNCIHHQRTVCESSLFQDFALSKGDDTRGVVNNPISKLWADADGSWISAKVEKCRNYNALTIEFSNQSRWPPNVAIHPQHLSARKRTAKQKSLYFLARKMEQNEDSGKLIISVRVIDENLRHWSYVTNPLNHDVLGKVLEKNNSWETVEIDLESHARWKLWDSDGNRDMPPHHPSFEWIVGVVITVDRDKPNREGLRAGSLQIAKLGFEPPTNGKPR